MGYDRLIGGSGADTFAIMAPGDQADTVADFSHLEGDRIVLNSSAFGGLDDQFREGDFLIQSDAPKATSSDPWLLYNTTTGNLNYDADGSGAGTPVLIATLENSPGLYPNDFAFL
jgi:Ca2+-binding RTX toxin-like protein